ncbi:MAG: hypothetical protein KBD66_00165 [Candidatus Doudnabacteria bacterium]|nr:hypothetical protein [Candidatus Doudnabacteria bacterium]
MNIEFYNCPSPEQFETKILPKEKPLFVEYRPDFALIDMIAREYGHYSNVLVIGHGGSVSAFAGIFGALKEQATKQAYILDTVDADYIHALRQKLTPENTVVIACSKSGQTVTQLEALSSFMSFPLVCITESASSLGQVAQKMSARVVPHPPIGGRFTGLTEVALIPAALCGFDVAALYAGGAEVLRQYDGGGLAWKAASVLWQLEQKGYVDVFVPVYSKYLYALSELITQLCHESFGKAGKGQTYVAAEAPESQHHMNQRFFGGRKNMAGWFISSGQRHGEDRTVFPTQVHRVVVRGRHAADLSGVSLGNAMRAELEATMEDGRMRGIPLAHISLSSVSEKTLGACIAFFELYAVYSSLLRDVDPFDQPQVEASKELSLNKRLAVNGF